VTAVLCKLKEKKRGRPGKFERRSKISWEQCIPTLNVTGILNDKPNTAILCRWVTGIEIKGVESAGPSGWGDLAQIGQEPEGDSKVWVVFSLHTNRSKKKNEKREIGVETKQAKMEPRGSGHSFFSKLEYPG